MVFSTASGSEAIALAQHGQPDLVVLDLGLPDIPGRRGAQELRTFVDVPILMLTAKSAESDRIRGLELGADDYMTKPFSSRELVLRTQAILRRWRATPPAPTAPRTGTASSLSTKPDTKCLLVG